MSGPVADQATELRSASATGHELRFTVAIAGEERELWFRSSAPIAAAAEAAAVATLMPAMAVGLPLRIGPPVAPAVIDAMDEAQAVLCAWARSGVWPSALPFEAPIELVARDGEAVARTPGRGVAAFFSGGVDSLTTVLRHPETSHLIHVEGFDVPLERADVAAAIRERIAAAASELGKELTVVSTNIRELSDPHVPWVTYYGSVLGAIALLLSGEMSRVLIASGITQRALWENGSHPLLDHLWGADRVEIVHDGSALTRVDKIELLANEPTAQHMLRVCWQNPDGAYNCGACEKCLRTMVTLEILGVRPRFDVFERELDLDAVATVELGNRPEIEFWLDILELAGREAAAPELIEAIESCLTNADPMLLQTGDSAGDSAVESEATPLEPEPDAAGALYIRPEDRRRLAEAGTVVFLIGSYEGWGNYGDLAQVQSALDLLGDELADAVACPVLSLHAARSHELHTAGTGRFGDEATLYYLDGAVDADHLAELGLVPAILPATIARAASWLYGGGYLNSRWGLGKLRMAEATRAAARRAGVAECELIASGLQIESDWLRGLDGRYQVLLARARLVGTRDELSAQTAIALAGGDGAVERTGDDAVGVIRRVAPVSGVRRDRPREALALNLHYCAGEWVADDAHGMRDFIERLAVELGRVARQPLRIQPLVAYDDPRMSEAPALGELTAAISARDPRAAIAEPIVLTATNLPAAAPAIAGAELTISCSYHVALTSLMLGVAVVLPRANPYYAQKAEGLRRQFSLPAELLPDPGSDPADVARRALAALRDGELDLEVGRAEAIGRRAHAENQIATTLRELLGGRSGARRPTAVEVLPAEADALIGGLERAYARIDALRTQVEWQANRLDDISRSASWRLTAPVRAAKRAVRRRAREGRGAG